MKKLLGLFSILFLVSCSQDSQELIEVAKTADDISVENGILKFQNQDAFLKYYNILTEMESADKIENWVNKDGFQSLYYVRDSANSSEVFERENTVRNYSTALKALLNTDSKLKIGNDLMWLDEGKFYSIPIDFAGKSTTELKSALSKFKIYGTVSNYDGVKSQIANNTNREVIANANKSITWEHNYYYGRPRRVLITLFNETIMFNEEILQSTKMFLKVVRQGEYKSTWKKRWNVDEGSVFIKVGGWSNWSSNPLIYPPYDNPWGYRLTEINNTVMIADGSYKGAPFEPYPTYFKLTQGSVSGTVQHDPSPSTNGTLINFTKDIFWYD
jgi:hypothetical protein